MTQQNLPYVLVLVLTNVNFPVNPRVRDVVGFSGWEVGNVQKGLEVSSELFLGLLVFVVGRLGEFQEKDRLGGGMDRHVVMIEQIPFIRGVEGGQTESGNGVVEPAPVCANVAARLAFRQIPGFGTRITRFGIRSGARPNQRFGFGHGRGGRHSLVPLDLVA